MRSELDALPRYSSERTCVDAEVFNPARLALLRLGSPQRIPLAGLRTLAMVLDEETWICRDAGLNDLPILAWLDFEASGRTRLNDPVPCLYYVYHAHAEMIRLQVLDIIAATMRDRLRAG
ncbi:MAG: hypothetical protein GWO16_01030 [Gammaproteobacteria bacterium]|nr:hypothetical protein [Gammaproteobacteria bacterium]NIR28308.1 hypothetical protein [Gammaproteobacteria bacterium]NIR96722.1 hypothetical protein [Gammaproteobacteria bacterium]NIT62424.1 hypothetical protein [Gammaproteobacteria bacterium]NIV19357.1 hypothetical protein [Gammaproteobacteria bacterium]